ncbi:hypothetical protein IE81DRAFT_244561 [Ceraceosorus guamensis]|uniref:RTA1-domain-containing protein n=1 Tax=Ceraceosorus guamensis TaxID=1522189 RepID=A0A316W5E1_9BASI|nr:hypothetical protein IE81DRAFT_244561 [Ceraceosorus guamensis]PWN44952.1 hypothetical protein IE81DRAFT_244561 [Ceraceosorus guamensis]
MIELLDRVLTYGPYGYIPKLAPAILFVILYAIAFIGHSYLGAFKKQPSKWLPTLALGCAAETGAMSLRVYGHYTARDDINAYIAQQVLSVLTPAFFAAAHFAILGLAIVTFGPAYAPKFVQPRFIIPFFVTVDVLSLILQGTGAGMAAVAEQLKPPESTIPGAWIVVSGLVVQLLGYVIFNILFVDFARRAMARPPQHELWTAKMKTFLAAVWISALLVLLRSCFRTGEMILGWIGPVATTEWYFYVFDAAPVTAAVYILLPFHPALFLPAHISLGKPTLGAKQEYAVEGSGADEKDIERNGSNTNETATLNGGNSQDKGQYDTLVGRQQEKKRPSSNNSRPNTNRSRSYSSNGSRGGQAPNREGTFHRQ